MGDQIEVQVHARPDLPTLWFDAVKFSLRKEGETDNGLGFIFFFQSLPGIGEGRFEVARMVTSAKQIKAMLNMMCKLTDFYPEKPTAQTPTKTV